MENKTQKREEKTFAKGGVSALDLSNPAGKLCVCVGERADKALIGVKPAIFDKKMAFS